MHGNESCQNTRVWFTANSLIRVVTSCCEGDYLV